jgi:beta-lactamase regulating signal transducer with metallopeptidase domain
MAMAFCRTAIARYTIAVAALALMVLSPIVTYIALNRHAEAALPNSIQYTASAVQTWVTSPVPASNSIDWLSAAVLLWFAGVLVFSVRALGGWFVLGRLRREKSELDNDLRDLCLFLQQRLGINRTIGYFQSRLVDSPAVVGWFRPMVLLPLTAVTGLSPEQLEAVIVHELAHIKRFDSFVNLFQIATETVLFYHPAIWWVNRCIRAERENCCDDIAISLCGNAIEYAKALTAMEAWRATPALVLAANSGSLKSRISRLLGIPAMTTSVPRAGLAVIGLFCAAGALFAAARITGNFEEIDTESIQAVQEPAPAPEPPAAPEPPPAAEAESPTPAAPAPAPTPAPVATPAPIASPAPAATPAPAAPKLMAMQTQPATQPPTPPVPPKGSYIGGLEAAGLKNVSVDQLIALKIQGVTPEYIRDIQAAGLKPSVDDLIALKIQGVKPDYIREIRATGLNPTLSDFIALRIQGVSADYVRRVESQGLKDPSVGDIIAMRIQNVEPADAGEFKKLNLQNVTIHHLIAMRIQGVTPDYIRAMQAAGITSTHIDDYIGARIQGVTPEFVQKARSHGFTDLSLNKLIALKNADVF